MSEKKFLTLDEVSKELQLNIYTIRSLLKRGTLKAEKLTNKLYVHVDELNRFLESTKETMVQK